MILMPFEPRQQLKGHLMSERNSSPDHLKQYGDTEDTHHSFEVVREHMKVHLSTDSRQRFSQEVCSSHPIFERFK